MAAWLVSTAAALGPVRIRKSSGITSSVATNIILKSFRYAIISACCVIDCLIAREDTVAARNALELARSFGAKVWDHSPLQMKQIEQIGVVAVRKLAAAGITDIEELEATEAPRIDMILSKNPPFGMKLLARLKEFPKLRVTMKVVGTVRVPC